MAEKVQVIIEGRPAEPPKSIAEEVIGGVMGVVESIIYAGK